MKNFWTMIVLAGLVALVAVVPAVAQTAFSGNQLDVSFSAPMAFYAGDTKMPAGSYHITQGVGEGVLLVKSGKHEVLVPYTAVASQSPLKKIEVTFNKYGNDEYLNSIAFGGMSAHDEGSWILQINPSATEQAAAKAAAATKHKVSGSSTKTQ